MTKELNIENIKKELVDKISNNKEVLEIFRKCEYLNDKGKCLREYGDSFIKDNYIFGFCVAKPENFIFVEVDEEKEKRYVCGELNYETWYEVTIVVKLRNISELDRLSMLLGDIATKSYPHMHNYSNHSKLITVEDGFGKVTRHAREITFTIV